MGAPSRLALWCIVASACADDVPEKLTKIASDVEYPGQRRFVAQGERVYLQTTKVGENGVALIQEEFDYRKFFSRDSKVVVATETRWSWQATGAADSLFVFSESDGDKYAGGARWVGQPKIPLYQCTQGGSISLSGSGERPVIFLDCFNCNLGCDSLSTYRDAAIFVGNAATHTFHKSCAPDFLKPRDVVPNEKYFVFEGSDFIRVSQLNANDELETVALRNKPDGVAQVFGIFDEDLSILASTTANEVVEFNAFDGGVSPSRFQLPADFALLRVFRPAPNATFALGVERDATNYRVKRSTREADWSRTIDLVTPGRTEIDFAVSTRGVVALQLEHLDAGTVDVWLQRFPY